MNGRLQFAVGKSSYAGLSVGQGVSSPLVQKRLSMNMNEDGYHTLNMRISYVERIPPRYHSQDFLSL